MSNMFVAEVHITPEIASRLLQSNPRNRTLNRAKVNSLVSDMKQGKFETTHQPIAISEDGELIDGQHRLTAVVESGVAVDMLVAHNAKRSTKIDIGAVRDVRTSLWMAGVIERDSLEYKNITYTLIRFCCLRTFGQQFLKACSAEDYHNIYMHHREDFDAVVPLVKSCSKAGFPSKSAVLVYCMLCAYHDGVPINTINKWYNIASTQDYAANEVDVESIRINQSISSFVSYASGKKLCIGSKTQDIDEFIKKCMSSIRHFEKRNVIKKLYGEYCYREYTISPDDIKEVSE